MDYNKFTIELIKSSFTQYAATGTIKVSFKEAVEMYGNTLIIPNYSKLICKDNDLSYTIFLPRDDARLNMQPRAFFIATIKQGEMETSQGFTGTGEKLQSFNVIPSKGKEIDMHEIKVYVNSQEWKVYNSIYDMGYKVKGCVVKTGMTEGIDIFFGNGYYGEICR
jgi:hypothetical protein